MAILARRRRATSITYLAALSAGLLLAACSSDEGGGDDGTMGGGSGGTTTGAGGSGASTSGGATGGTGTGPGASSDWTQMGYDAASTYFNRAETTITKQSARNLAVAWTKDLGSNIYSAPLHVGDRLYVAGATIQALNASNGSQIWENGTPTTAAMAYADGTLYVHDGFAILHALDAENGQELWQTDLSTHPDASGFSSPIIAGDFVFIGGSTGSEVAPGNPTFRGYVVAVNKDTGAITWQTYTVPEGATGAALWSSVSVDLGSNRVFAATGNNYTQPATDTSDAFLALNYDSGMMEWKSQRRENDVWSLSNPGGPDFDFGANPVLYEASVDGAVTQLVAAGQKSGDAHAVRRDTGQLVWTRNLGPGNSSGSAGVFNNTTWTGTHLLVAVNSATSAAPGGEPMHPLAAATAVVFALDGGTGNILWERQVPGEVMAPITVANGVGFVGAGPVFEAFDVDTGEVLARIDTDATIACPPTAANGRVAFGNGLGWLFGTPGSTLTVLSVP